MWPIWERDLIQSHFRASAREFGLSHQPRVEVQTMAISLPARRRRKLRRHEVHKPTGALHPRVEKVGPEHFGIVSIDCAKARSKWMLADFFGNVLIEPVVVPHTRDGFRAAIARLRQAVVDHHLDDLVVAVERTGRYHLPVKRAFV